jgi:hypothetical protein
MKTGEVMSSTAGAGSSTGREILGTGIVGGGRFSKGMKVDMTREGGTTSNKLKEPDNPIKHELTAA